MFECYIFYIIKHSSNNILLDITPIRKVQVNTQTDRYTYISVYFTLAVDLTAKDTIA